TVCVVGKIRDLILQLSKSSIYSTKPRHRITAKRSMGVAAGDGKSASEIIATKSAGWFDVDLASGPDISVETEVRAWQ
ncbi:hypothetical protein QCN14_19460, partial [Enterobacter roggenkampii]